MDFGYSAGYGFSMHKKLCANISIYTEFFKVQESQVTFLWYSWQ